MSTPNVQGFMNFRRLFRPAAGDPVHGAALLQPGMRRAILIPTPEAQASEAIWGARVFLICAGLFTVSLIAVGLDWPAARCCTPG